MTINMLDERRQTIIQPPNNLPYIVAVVVMMLMGVVGIVGLTMIRPEADNTILIGLMLGFLAPTTLSLLAFMKSQETHLSVNSRLDAFMANAKLAAHAVGVSEGRAEGRQTANDRTDSLAAQTFSRQPVVEPVKVEVVNSPLQVEDTTNQKDT